MQVIPAIDILGGRCARLYKGDYERETVFDDDPVDAARRWADMGAERLHVVDLDGAKDGVRVNAHVVHRIVKAVDVPVQVGGGIRNVKDADEVLSSGVEMVIFGTAAVENPEEVQSAVDRFGKDRVCVGVDALDGNVRTRGWLSTTALRALDMMNDMANNRGVRRFIYTDTSRDGALSHPNFEELSDLVEKVKYPIVAAGGVATLEDILRLQDIGVAGAITGMAIYTGALNLYDAIRAIDESKLNRDIRS